MYAQSYIHEERFLVIMAITFDDSMKIPSAFKFLVRLWGWSHSYPVMRVFCYVPFFAVIFLAIEMTPVISKFVHKSIAAVSDYYYIYN